MNKIRRNLKVFEMHLRESVGINQIKNYDNISEKSYQ